MRNLNIDKSITEIFETFRKRAFSMNFTLEAVYEIFEIGNEVFQRNNPEEVEKIQNRPKTEAPDLFEDEPMNFERTFKIYSQLNARETNLDVNKQLVRQIFEINSRIAWEEYRTRYLEYMMNIYREYPDDDYFNYLAAVILFEEGRYEDALSALNLALPANNSSAALTHLKGLCLMNTGEFNLARTYFYNALYLIDLTNDVSPKPKKNPSLYPNYPINFHTSSEQVRNDLRKLDRIDNLFYYGYMQILES